MATPQDTTAAGSPPSPQVVGNVFVQQYYHVLHHQPEHVHRFYLDESKLGRPDPQGAMSSITTTDAIKEKILSMDYQEFRAEIKTVDAQESFGGGVIVLVTGYLIGVDDVKKNFTQSFFLASQDKGYYVLNDLFRYIDEPDHQQGDQILPDHQQGDQILPDDESETPLLDDGGETPSQEQQIPEPEQAMPSSKVKEELNEEEVYKPSDNGEASVVDEGDPVDEVIDEVPNSSPPSAAAADSGSTAVQEEAPKKSYASIVKVMKENIVPLSVPASTSSRPKPAKPEWKVVPALAPAPAPAPLPAPSPEVPVANSISTGPSTIQETEADGYSIYVKSLPLNATAAQLEEEFKRFGPIKPGGIQVRSQKPQGFCFGFVEFEVASAVQSAIEASPLTIGGRQVYIEEKRPPGSRVILNRGRFLPGRGGGFRNDGVRGRGSYSGGRGYGRGDYISRGSNSGRGARGPISSPKDVSPPA